MKLVGVLNGQEYYPVRGIHDGVPYQIVQERGRFLLERVSIVIGAGMMGCPVGFFGDEWQGVYSCDENHLHLITERMVRFADNNDRI